MLRTSSRRDFLKSTAAVTAGASAWGPLTVGARAGHAGAGDRPVVGYIGSGIRYGSLMMSALPHSACAAICDVDSAQLQNGAANHAAAYDAAGLSPPPVMLCEDYRRVLERPDIDAVIVSTPDHWHAKIAIEAMRAGKDVYCEKPLTLTIAEGDLIVDAIAETGRVFQVGTQQRSGRMFQTAAAMMREGRVGKPQRVTCGIGGSPTSGPLPECAPPSGLNWNRWLGPAPWATYRAAPGLPAGGYGSEHPFSRAHAHFRWWYEYAGGKLTDWGAHHVDIAMWALDKSSGDIGPYRIDPMEAKHPVDMVDGYPVGDDRFNAATSFKVRVTFADGAILDIVQDTGDLSFDNGIMFQGEKGRYFVNRGKLTGRPVEDLNEQPLDEAAYTALHPSADTESDFSNESHGTRNTSHMAHFFDCLKSRRTPISDAASHHRNLTVCHASNIALRLGRVLTYDPSSQRFVGDEQANTFLSREYRKGFEIEA